jgi:hypothetical protein
VRYFHCPADAFACAVKVPPGKTTIQVQGGFRRKHVTIERAFPAGDTTELPVRLPDNDLPADFGRFLSADLHVHMNYGGHYRHTPETLIAQQDAEDLDVVYNLLVNKEERIPDIGYFRAGGGADPASGKRLLFHAQEFHTSFWGHMGLLNLEDHFLGTPRSRAPGRTTARSRTLRARRARSSATCTSRISRSTRRRRRSSPTSCPPPSRTARWITSR